MSAGDGSAPERWIAPAKVNLWLAVGPRRPDGLHEVDTCYQAIDLADRIAIARAPAGIELECSVEGDMAAGVPVGEENLAARAARLLAERTGHELRVSIRIEKRVPAGAGLGGASSDAAAVLLALARRFAVPDPEHTLVDLATELGADVPFFLQGGTQRAGGIGDDLGPTAPPNERWGILLWPGVAVPTGEAYGWLDAERGEDADQPLPPSLGGGRGNDFEAVVGLRVPAAGRGREIVASGPARVARMSGSGSASFALYASERERDGDLQRIHDGMARLPGGRIWRFECVDHGVRAEPGRRSARAAG